MSRPATSERTKLLATLVTLTVLVVSSSTAASVYVAGDAGRRATARGSGLALDVAPFEKHARVLALLDSLVAPLGEAQPLDSASLRDVVAHTTQRPRGNDQSARTAWITVAGTGDTAAMSLELFRRFARSAPLPSLWGYRSDIVELPALQVLPIRSVQRLKVGLVANEAAADSLLRIGDARGAMQRARENMAVARHLLDQPIAIDMMIGRVALQQGVRLLSRVALEAGEFDIATRAKELDALMLSTYRTGPFHESLRTMGRDASSDELLVVAANRKLPPALRVESAVAAAVTGSCLNTREVLFGVSDERRALVSRIDAALGDIDRAHDIVTLAMRSLQGFDNGMRETLIAAGVPPGEFAPQSTLDRMVPGKVQGRVTYCRFEF